MLLKAVSSCLHARRPSRGCPGNLTCISQSMTCQCFLASPVLKKTPTTTQRAPPMVLCGAVAIRVLQVPTHALLLSVVEAMERTSATWASKLGSREGWSKHFRSGFCKRRVLRMNPWAWQLALEGGVSIWLQPLWSPCSSSPLLFLYTMLFLHCFPPIPCYPCLSPL